MEKLNKEKPIESATSAKEMKEAFRADVPADELEENRDEEIEIHEEISSDSKSDSSSDSDSDSEFECDICKKKCSSYLNLKQHQKGKKHAKAVLRKKKEKKLLKGDEIAESDEEHLVQELYAECKICKKEFFGPEAYEQHLKCKKHKQKALEISILEQIKEEGKINEDKLLDLCKAKRLVKKAVGDVKEKVSSLTLDDEDEMEPEEFECKKCEKQFSGLIPYYQHLMSKTHAKAVEKKSLLHKVIPETSKEEENPVKSEHDDVNTLCIEDGILVCKSCSTAFPGPESAMTHMKSKKHAKNLEKYLRKLEKRKEKKRSKDIALGSKEENMMEAEHEEYVDARNVKLHKSSTPDDFGRSEMSNSSIDNAVKASTSCQEVNEELSTYEKYKKYKTLMNSYQEDELSK